MSSPDVIAAFHDASDAFVRLVASIDPTQWDEPATEVWTILELVAHTSRAFVAIEETLAWPLDQQSTHLAGASDYFRSGMSIPGLHEGISDRARRAAALISDDPPAHVRELADRVGQVVDATARDREVQHYAGRIAIADYLATRLTELVLHGVDIQVAVGDSPSAPADAAGIVRDVLLGVSDRSDALRVACALSGRSRALACDVLA